MSRLLSSVANENHSVVTWSQYLVGSVPLKPSASQVNMIYALWEDQASTKPATLDRRDIQSTNSVLERKLTHALDHTSCQARREVDVFLWMKRRRLCADC